MPRNKNKLVLTREQCRAVDRYAIDVLGIPGVVLMENAGRNAAELIAKWCGKPNRRNAKDVGHDKSNPIRAAILCGKGNNGGDGFVIARHLQRMGHQPIVYLAADANELSGDAAINFKPLEKLGIPVRALQTPAQLRAAVQTWKVCDAIVDALLGTGFQGEVREPLRQIIEAVNSISLPRCTQRGRAGVGAKHASASSKRKDSAPQVIAIDIPSGLNADTGLPGGAAIRATKTITFFAAKSGFGQVDALSYLGTFTVADIGLVIDRKMSIKS